MSFICCLYVNNKKIIIKNLLIKVYKDCKKLNKKTHIEVREHLNMCLKNLMFHILIQRQRYEIF